MKRLVVLAVHLATGLGDVGPSVRLNSSRVVEKLIEKPRKEKDQ
jgi:hypothetical protein